MVSGTIWLKPDGPGELQSGVLLLLQEILFEMVETPPFLSCIDTLSGMAIKIINPGLTEEPLISQVLQLKQALCTPPVTSFTVGVNTGNADSSY